MSFWAFLFRQLQRPINFEGTLKISMDNFTVGIIGCGTLGSLIAEGIHAGQAGPYRLKGVFDEPAPNSAKELAGEIGASYCESIEDLLQLKCDYVIEAATAESLQKYAVRCIESGSNLIILSSGALANKGFHEIVSKAAQENHKKVHLPSGAIGALDLAQAAAMGGNLSVTMSTEKPPAALLGAPALASRQLSENKRELVFQGTALEAVAGFPKNVNVVASLSLATIGLDHVTMKVYSDPNLLRNKHAFVLDGNFGRATLEIEAAPSARNPKSSALASYSILALLKKLASPIQLG